MIGQFEKGASEAYGYIIRRYPAMDRALDAKARLEALKLPVPKPTRAALELNKKEVASRREPSMMSSMIGTFTKHPDTDRATRVGEPTMTETKPVNATDVVRAATAAIGDGKGTENKLGVTTVNVTPGPNQPAPRSDDPAPAADPGTASPPDATAQPPADATAQQPPAAGELTPNVAPDANELKPNVAPDPNALPPLQQNNELANGNGSASSSTSSSNSTQKQDELVDISSSKKKKKGLAKLKPF
jgi:hypothetical protein